MQKLLDAFKANPSHKAAKRIVKYAEKHPMWPATAGGPANMATFYLARKWAGSTMAGY
jgi:hypothetical protein